MDKKIISAYENAKERFAALGADTEKAIETADNTPMSLHCWQGDDVNGFENFSGGLTGGIQATGNYPGRARTPNELRSDMEKAMSFIPGALKVSLHALYLESDAPVDRNAVEPCHFAGWADWANTIGAGLDFNQTFFSHEKSGDFSLSSQDPGIRDFWIEHAIRCRRIGEFFGKKIGKTCVTNLWIHDGCKEVPIDRISPRQRLAESLDRIFAEKIDEKYNKDALESKLFGIGSESYVVGSHEFYMGYAQKNGKLLTLDTGHFHPTETVSGKISAVLLFVNEILLHLSRPVRWDSDHVVILDDELSAIMQDIVRGSLFNRVNIGLDYFDASINRVAAWTIGARNARKALLKACLEPVDLLKKLEAEGDGTSVLALTEELKGMPWGAVWDYYCLTRSVPVGAKWLAEVKKYEEKILSKRV